MQMLGLVHLSIFLAAASFVSSRSRDHARSILSESVRSSKGLASVLLASPPVVKFQSLEATSLVKNPKQLAAINERARSASMESDLDKFLGMLDETEGTEQATTTIEEHLYIRENRKETWDEKVERFRKEHKAKQAAREAAKAAALSTATTTWDPNLPTTTTGVPLYIRENREETWDEKVARHTSTTDVPLYIRENREETYDEKVARYRVIHLAKQAARKEARAARGESEEDYEPKAKFQRMDFKQQLKLKLKMKLKMERKMDPRFMQLKRERKLRLKTALKQKLKMYRPIPPQSWGAARPSDPSR